MGLDKEILPLWYRYYLKWQNLKNIGYFKDLKVLGFLPKIG